jgi:hypothetical protein
MKPILASLAVGYASAQKFPTYPEIASFQTSFVLDASSEYLVGPVRAGPGSTETTFTGSGNIVYDHVNHLQRIDVQGLLEASPAGQYPAVTSTLVQSRTVVAQRATDWVEYHIDFTGPTPTCTSTVLKDIPAASVDRFWFGINGFGSLLNLTMGIQPTYATGPCTGPGDCYKFNGTQQCVLAPSSVFSPTATTQACDEYTHFYGGPASWIYNYNYVGEHGIPVKWLYSMHDGMPDLIETDISAVFSSTRLLNISAAEDFFAIPAYCD